MSLWLLRPTDDNSDIYDYDCAHGFVVRAASAEDARRMIVANADTLCGLENPTYGPNPWANPTATSCIELTADGPAEVIMRDFRHG